MPRWLLIIITSTIASITINLLHAGEEEKSKKARGGKSREDDAPERAKEGHSSSNMKAVESLSGASIRKGRS
jgi:hypothetical protein